MPLVKMSSVLGPAMEDGYAVGAFNADNIEMVQAFVEAAEEERSPLILQVSQGAIEYSGLSCVTNLAGFAAAQASVPIVVHLDHGKDYKQNVRALRAGVTCLGIDASMRSYAQNSAMTRQICELAHFAGLEAEAGLGYVPDSANNPSADAVEESKTDPSQAAKFIKETRADLLAVALGSMRGMRQREISLDIDRLKAIRSLISVPLVLHGSSGVKWNSIQQAIQYGICKVNLAACFDRRLTEVMRKELAQMPKEINFRKIIGPSRDAVKDLAREQLQLLGSSGCY
jgi:fructose-bisphosphate aldolase class II